MRRAFTLIEMLIVLVLISIVTTLGIQAFVKIRDDARKQTLTARIKQLDIAKEQFIAEYGRLQAETIWAAPQLTASYPSSSVPPTFLGAQTHSDDEERYNLLKRYIERPQDTVANVAPDNCSIITPGNVHTAYQGTIILDSNFVPLGYPPTLVPVYDTN